MPDKFSKIYQNKITGVGFLIKNQIPSDSNFNPIFSPTHVCLDPTD